MSVIKFAKFYEKNKGGLILLLLRKPQCMDIYVKSSKYYLDL